MSAAPGKRKEGGGGQPDHLVTKLRLTGSRIFFSGRLTILGFITETYIKTISDSNILCQQIVKGSDDSVYKSQNYYFFLFCPSSGIILGLIFPTIREVEMHVFPLRKTMFYLSIFMIIITIFYCRSRDIVVGLAAGYGLNDRGVGV
jgi:hypothetical protein